LPIDELRGGSVKARRPRARAVEAKRRALHAAEHSANIECVMAEVMRSVTLWSQGAPSDGPKYVPPVDRFCRTITLCNPSRSVHGS
jgi:hypothetical protein